MFYKMYYRFIIKAGSYGWWGERRSNFKMTAYPYVHLSQFHNAVFKEYILLLL